MHELGKERRRCTELVEEMKKKEKNWEIRLRILEEKVEEVNTKIKGLEEVMGEIASRDKVGESEESENTGNRSRSRGSMKNESSWGGSVFTDISEDRLSLRKVGKLKKWIADKDKEERRNNIVIKGMRIERGEHCKGDVLKGHVTRMLKENLKLEHKDYKVEFCRWSGKIIIVKLGSEEEKKDVMRRKNKLKGGQIFIENDLSWEERQTQSRINKWAKNERSKGLDIKIGIGKVRINGVWKFWGEVEKDLREEVSKEIGDEENIQDSNSNSNNNGKDLVDEEENNFV